MFYHRNYSANTDGISYWESTLKFLAEFNFCPIKSLTFHEAQTELFVVSLKNDTSNKSLIQKTTFGPRQLSHGWSQRVAKPWTTGIRFQIGEGFLSLEPHSDQL
jgi:hypothetical protein